MDGFGCNAAGLVATRIINYQQERLMAVIINNYSLCYGSWPTQILIATIFIGAIVLASLSPDIGTALLGIFFIFFFVGFIKNGIKSTGLNI